MPDEPFHSDAVAEYEKDTWSRCAETYMAGFGALVADAIDPLLDAAAVDGDKAVLDVGSGPGLVAAAAASRGADTIGIDFSEEMVTQARRLYPDVAFRKAAAEALPFDAERFDAVVGNFVLHHCGRPEKVLDETFRVLRSGGRMAFTVWAELDKLEAFGLFFAAVEEHAGAAELPHGPLFGVSDFEVFRRMTRQAGFRDPSVTGLDVAWRTPSIDAYLAAFRDWANLQAFAGPVSQKIESTVRQRANAYRSDNGFVIPNPAILVSAVK